MKRSITESELRALVREALADTVMNGAADHAAEPDSAVRQLFNDKLDLTPVIDDVLGISAQVVLLLKDHVYISDSQVSKNELPNRLANAVMKTLRKEVNHIIREFEMEEEGNRW